MGTTTHALALDAALGDTAGTRRRAASAGSRRGREVVARRRAARPARRGPPPRPGRAGARRRHAFRGVACRGLGPERRHRRPDALWAPGCRCTCPGTSSSALCASRCWPAGRSTAPTPATSSTWPRTSTLGCSATSRPGRRPRRRATASGHDSPGPAGRAAVGPPAAAGRRHRSRGHGHRHPPRRAADGLVPRAAASRPGRPTQAPGRTAATRWPTTPTSCAGSAPTAARTSRSPRRSRSAGCSRCRSRRASSARSQSVAPAAFRGRRPRRALGEHARRARADRAGRADRRRGPRSSTGRGRRRACPARRRLIGPRAAAGARPALRPAADCRPSATEPTDLAPPRQLADPGFASTSRAAAGSLKGRDARLTRGLALPDEIGLRRARHAGAAAPALPIALWGAPVATAHARRRG